MGDVSLSDLKRRIKSIKNTQKITKAVGLVATSKFKKARGILENTKGYFEAFNEISNNAFGRIQENFYGKEKDSDTYLYIIITSDSGLSGSYNANVINRALDEMHEKKILLITLGQRGRTFFKKRKYETIAEYVEIGIVPSQREVYDIVKHIIKYFNEGKVRAVNILYTKYKSPLSQDIEVLKLLPIDIGERKTEKYFELDPSVGDVMEYLIPAYIRNTIYYCIASSSTSEYAIRMRAMDSATKNASEILERLHNTYNRVRQSNITQEITEIVSGAEALKD